MSAASGGAMPSSGPAASRAEITFTAEDRTQLEACGITLAEAARQMALLAEPDHAVRIERACTVGDGIVQLDPATRARHENACAEVVAAGRCTRFVPASGAASRMFAELERARGRTRPFSRATLAAETAAGSLDAIALTAFLDGARRLALWDSLAAHAGADGADRLLSADEFGPLLDALLGEAGMAAASQPKGLLPFHRDGSVLRTAFDEQLAEAATLGADRDGVARAHFTVSSEHRGGFETALEPARARTPGVRLDVTFSVQHPSSDTLAADQAGAPFRLSSGQLLLRPAGHGALIGNLNDLGGDIVLIKNIDNVVPDRLKAPTYEWSRILIGMVADLEARCHDWTRRLETDLGAADLDQAEAFHARFFGESPVVEGGAADRPEALRKHFARPIRVCGMVRNTGEPGGGPYFVVAADGAARAQIVESAQVRSGDERQASLFSNATHFNPVFMACALRDAAGGKYDLHRFVDASAVIVTHKTAEGRPLLALERPGLWNGAMAGWNTVFVEVPGAVFNPVKSVLDLLRSEHRPA